MRIYYHNKNELKKIYKPGELIKLSTGYKFLNKEGTLLFSYNSSSNSYTAFAVREVAKMSVLADLYVETRRKEQGPFMLEETAMTEIQKQVFMELIVQHKKEEKIEELLSMSFFKEQEILNAF